MGQLFSKMLCLKLGLAKKVGLPPWKELQELDVQFRYSTPLKWMDLSSRRERHRVLKEVLCKNNTIVMDTLDGAKATKRRSKCDIQDRWVDAFYRAKRKWRKTKKRHSKDAKKKSKRENTYVKRQKPSFLSIIPLHILTNTFVL